MAIDIIASEGVFDAESEAPAMCGVLDALLRAIDATEDPQVSAVLGVALHVVRLGGR